MRLSRILLLLTVAYMYLSMAGTKTYKDPELKEYVDVFVYKASLYNIEVESEYLTIDFVHNFDTYTPKYSRSNIVGICYRNAFGGSHTKILIAREFYDKADNLERWILLAHELGHCLLDLEHNDSHENIMKSTMPPSHLYSEEWFAELLQTYKFSKYIKEQYCK